MKRHLSSGLSAGSLIICITLLLVMIASPVNAAVSPDTVAPISIRTQVPVTPPPQMATCQAPCECLEWSAATAKWGAGGFSQCAEKACGYGSTPTGLPAEKNCYKQKEVPAVQPLPFAPPVTTTMTYVQHVAVSLPTTSYPEVNKSLWAADTDNDGKSTMMDNCPDVYNPGQEDADKDHVGDECDNCLHTANPDQEDTDGDKIGDACDLCPNDKDPSTAGNLDDREAPGYADADEDGIGDRCDPCKLLPDSAPGDHDGDGVGDNCDNCYLVKNPDQKDSDLDCALEPKYSSKYGGNAGGDPGGIWWRGQVKCGDACDPVDSDLDGIVDISDNCPLISNPDQWDTNNDGSGDACSCSWCTSSKVRPVYLSGDVSQSIDIILVPSSTAFDTDKKAIVPKDRYTKSETDFRVVVTDNIRNGYLMLGSYSTFPILWDYKKKFNIYYYWDPASPADAHTGCGGVLPAGFVANVPFRDAAIILYPPAETKSGGEAIGGCSAGFGTPAQISAPGFWIPTMLHESGHGIFGLVDTYCSRPGIDTSYSQNDPFSNVWTSDANCKQAPESPYGNLNPVNCRRIDADDPATPKNPDCSIDFWRWDPDPDLMRDTDNSARFGKAGVRRINYVLESYGNP